MWARLPAYSIFTTNPAGIPLDGHVFQRRPRGTNEGGWQYFAAGWQTLILRRSSCRWLMTQTRQFLAACEALELRSALRVMSPRIIHIPLFGGARKAQAKGIRYAHGLHESRYREWVLIRSAAEAKIREADRLECEAWNAIMWAGGPAMPSPGDPQAEPTIGKAVNAVNGGFDLLEAKCNRSDRVSLVLLRALKQPPETPGPLYCEPCSEWRHYSRWQRAHIRGLAYVGPAEPRQTAGLRIVRYPRSNRCGKKAPGACAVRWRRIRLPSTAGGSATDFPGILTQCRDHLQQSW